jgi:hypothetical protein
MCALFVANGRAQEPVTWTQIQNATVSGATLAKSGGCDGCPDSGAVSQQTIAAGDGYVEFTAGQSNALKMIGLSNGNQGTSGAEIKWGVRFDNQLAVASVIESNTYRTDTSYSASDQFRVAIESGAIKYYKNGSLFYTSPTSATYPVLVDTALLSSGSQFSGVVIQTGGSSGPPDSYLADTSRTTRPEPTLPVLGAAGFTFVDPVFGSTLIRVTDGATRPGLPNRSYTTPSAPVQNAWNVDSTYFWVRATDGTIIPYQFDPTTEQVSRINPVPSGDGGLTIYNSIEPQFSFVSPSVLYGVRLDVSNMSPIATRIDLAQNGATTDLLDLRDVVPGLSNVYAAGIYSSAGPTERVMVLFGGPSADLHPYVVVFDAANPSNRILLNTSNSTVSVGGQAYSTNVPLNFTVHHAHIDKSGRYVVMTPQNSQPAALVLWDTLAAPGQGITLMDSGNGYLAGGHEATGWGTLVNQACCTSSSGYDALQWQFRSLATPQTRRDLIDPLLTPQAIYTGDHTSWNNARQDSLQPVVSAIARHPQNEAGRPWRAWDDEIVAIQTDATAGATVWRFAHHRSDSRSDADPAGLGFWYSPRAVISQDGKWALFTSNWEKTLGAAADATPAEQYRRDVFLLKLETGSDGPGDPGVQPVNWTHTVNATASANAVQKNAGCDGCADAGGVSAQQITAGDGHIEFTVSVGDRYVAGLSTDTSNTNSTVIEFAFSIWPNGLWEVRESNGYRTDGAYSAGDILKIAVEGGVVKYYVNGAVVYTSLTQPAYPLVFDTILMSTGATVSGAKIAQ